MRLANGLPGTDPPLGCGFHGIRYQVKDAARAVALYTQHLGFNLEHQQLPAFANVSFGDAQMLLSGR
jgi:glyoxylase I family protein